jgi:hypothetical protein
VKEKRRKEKSFLLGSQEARKGKRLSGVGSVGIPFSGKRVVSK